MAFGGEDKSLQDGVKDWSLDLLKCCNCNGGLAHQGTRRLACSNCGSEYPIANGVPMLLPNDMFLDAAEVIAAAAGGLEVEAVAEAMSSAGRYWLRDGALRGEFSQIINRYGSFFPARSSPEADGPALSTLVHYFNPRFAPGQHSYRSIRIRNNGETPLSSDGAPPFFLSYWLYDRHGRRLGEGPRSRFPVPLEPGQELTVPILIAAPAEPGAYRIRVMMVHEHVRWYEECPVFEGDLRVEGGRRFADGIESVPHQGFFDFERDLGYCGEFIAKAARLARGPKQDDRPLRILEVACGSDPQTMRFHQPGSQVVAMDLCYPQVQIASLQYGRGGMPDAYQFVSGDLGRAPFKAGAFDIVAISAALHHFADVTKALRWMADLVHDKGLVLLMREPSKVAANDPTYIAELKAGFNEQQFELDEYETMYALAGLAPVEQAVHFECSYKAILRKA